ncbi:MAG TPA: SPOR domain-containing protein, partial [Candidatus Glassbacteria bacterium]|nr:SPOR domain-containing protein [Candidatus Glassbacteria bacterium]
GTIFESRYLKAETPAALVGWVIQLGAFSSADRARSLAGKVSRLGLAAVVRPPGGDGLYRVRIEGIRSKEEFDRTVATLKKNRIDYNLISSGG